MELLHLNVDLPKLFLHRKLFMVWIIVVFIPFALIIGLLSGSSWLGDYGKENPSPTQSNFMLELPLHSQHQVSLNNDSSWHSQDKMNGNNKLLLSGKDEGRCNLFKGKWVNNPKGPLYTNTSCKYIQGHQNCIKNGRLDMGYLFWRWRPQDCSLPRFNATLFLQLVRGKVWGYVGDSIARNQMQSLLCMLSQVEHPNCIYKDEANVNVHWHFASYNFTLMVIWSPYLVTSTTEEMKGIPDGVVKLHLDVLDPNWLRQLQNMDVIILTVGQWFLQTSVHVVANEVVGCHNCEGIYEAKELGFYHAFQKAIKHSLGGIRMMPGFNGTVFLETFPIDHFKNGSWNTGGTCDRTSPYKFSEASLQGVNKQMHKIVVEEYKNMTQVEAPNDSKAMLVDITQVSLHRPDGHPGRYRDITHLSSTKNGVTPSDCLHWCLPGPIDTWNEILLKIITDL